MARPGDPFIDALLALCLEDDRGLTFARVLFTENLSPGIEPIPAFAFNFISEPDRTPLATLPPLEASAMWRQSVRLLPPSMEEVWLSPGRPELHGKTLDWIRAAKGGNLGKDQELWSQLVSTFNWQGACRSAGKEASAIAYSRPSVSDRSADALKRLRAEALAIEIQALARSHALGETFDRPAADRRQLLLESCISSPKMRLDACGVVLLAPLEPK